MRKGGSLIQLRLKVYKPMEWFVNYECPNPN